MKASSWFPMVAALLITVSPGLAAQPRSASENRAIDLAICLDISGSMSDLLDSVRGRIWDIVTDLSRATPTPALRVALITFGGEEPVDNGFIVRHTDFTNDLDTAYGKMMALHTNGGDEYVGWAIERAVGSLDWSTDSDALRLIFVAGNESADQGAAEHDFRNAVRAATDKDIIINSVYAGDREQGVSEKWDRVAQRGKGTYTAIDVVSGTIQIETPYDASLAALNGELNRTYIPYGKHGATGLANQMAQDKNALSMGKQSCGSRVAAKGCALYNAASWDLVDAVQKKDFRLEALKPGDLPAFMRSMTVDQRSEYVAAMNEVRRTIRAEIADTDQKRRGFIRRKQAAERGSRPSFDDALLASLRTQAIAKGFTYPSLPPVPETEMVTVPEGPPVPVRRLKTPVQANVDALVASLPLLEYGVDGYRSRNITYARRVADRISAPVRIFVGDREFAATEQARSVLLDMLRTQSDELQTIRTIIATAAPFVYASASATTNAATKGGTMYRIGGIDFQDLAIAERVRDDIREALISHKAKQVKSDHGKGSARLVSASESDLNPPLSIDDYREQIRVIAETAGWSYMTLVDGC